MASDFEARLWRLETRLGELFRRLLNVESAEGALAQQIAQGSGSGSGGGGGSAWFWTTSSITIAAATGTTLATAALTCGSGAARHCIVSGGTRIPDTSTGVTDTTIYNGLNGTAIPTGQFVKCDLNDDGDWVIDIAWC